jgi:hypothetical protein
VITKSASAPRPEFEVAQAPRCAFGAPNQNDPSSCRRFFLDWPSFPPRLSTNTLLFILLTAFCFAPALLVDIPAMGDYPNHLARMHLLATLSKPDANPFYEIKWGPLPNLAMDIIVPLFSSFNSVEIAAKTFLILAQALVVSGVMVLEFVVQRRLQFSGLVALALLYSIPFGWGFLNFQFGIGLSIWAVAGWICLESRPLLRFLVHFVLVPILFFSHLFALGMYGVTIGIFELWQLSSQRTTITQASLIFCLMGLPVVILAVALFVYSGHPPWSLGSSSKWYFLYKLSMLIRFFNGYDPWVALIMFGVLASVFVLNWRKLSIHPAGIWLGIAYLVLFLSLPSFSAGAFIDVRIPVVACLVISSFVLPTNKLASRRLAGTLVVVSLGSAIFTAVIWISWQQDYRELKSSFSKIEPASFVLVAARDGAPPRNLHEFPMSHGPTLAAYYAKALVSSLFIFNHPDQQPIAVRPDLRATYIPIASPIPLQVLEAATPDRCRELADFGELSDFLCKWRERFDYLYLVGPKETDPLLSNTLEPLQFGKSFTLFRIKHPSTRSSK